MASHRDSTSLAPSTLWLLLAWLPWLTGAAPAPADPAQALVGTWGSERVLGPEVRGELTLTRDAHAWRARIAGFDVPARLEGNAVSFILPGGQGELRGTLSDDGQRISGHWIQPRVRTSGMKFATPVELRALRANIWRGDVAPLEDRFSLYLVIQKQADGTLSAFIRNPERNFGNRLLFRVSVQDGLVQLVATRGTTRLEGRFDAQARRLSLFYPPLDATFDFTPRERDQAVGLHPRIPATGAYVYEKPIAEEDGWTTASLDDVGMDVQPLRELVQRILDQQPGPDAAPAIQGLLVARHGKLVLEEYFQGFDKERPHDLRSASKTHAPLLMGIALDQGAPFTVDTPVVSLFPEYRGKLAHLDARKRKLTVEHLMTMSTGLACDDDDEASPGNEERLDDTVPDWYKYTLDLPMTRAPGEKGVYCSANINLLGGVLRKATRTWIPEFFTRYVAEPLQLRGYHLDLMPSGEQYLGGGIFMRPRDALKLGQLYLSGGVWNGRRVVSQRWVERSTALHATMEPGRTYGYAWWRHELRVGDRVYSQYEASGNGGQLVMVVPELDLVVMFTAGNYNHVALWRKFREELLPQFILRAARPTSPSRSPDGTRP
ncbi:serine hydrolase [Myxococcus llanfairpwllgwyngyllgogerychwyrndrobwllllantysiliogogogochensis]|uniref:Serine hydrolase n=1 Tax=Myxococcus llanfairpwllgwyngyllgogerychwyrndrobwllllantysiliogogogochensis TaxID=2590453 RepID=A0A540X8I4_9BACT|nr:serine hydrolase [Myxococcus llanfairpwllgwyngyllgogerychwyrndrobwllllantysiliogogogochensis]TQF17557.1 serine hydrolase [Myxococcus llanfairpwllgwyngyllgogerychwyrndrobwllllantysiliogogogochensis]